MKTFLDCVPCLVRQTLESVRYATDDTEVHRRVMRRVLAELSNLDTTLSPPAMAQRIHRLIRDETRDADPYAGAKRRSNALAAELAQDLAERIAAHNDPFHAAVRAAIAGNIIDFAAFDGLSDATIRRTMDQAMDDPMVGASTDDLARAVADAREVLYLADNAGEVFFDALLARRLPAEKTTVAVRGRPILNDATLADAEAAGLTALMTVVGNGSDAPGTLLDDCDDAFRRRFDQADLVIAKGQGNYETLSDQRKNIFFMLKAKCPVIAAELNCRVGDLVLHRSTP